MTATATRERGSRTTGVRPLLRLLLRRDRITLPAWIAGLALFVFYVGAALPQVAPTEPDLAAMTPMLQQPIGRLLTGPAYGLERPTYAAFFATGYALYLHLLAALMNIQLISRHTRAEEQSGRAELVRADVTGRDAGLTAALLLALGVDALAFVAVTAACVAVGFPLPGSALVGAAAGLIGLLFAAVTAVTAQLTESSRAASGVAGAVLGACFLVRALGDASAVGGGALSWASPLGWAGQTAPFVLNRWWPLLGLLVLTCAAVPAAYALQARRDFGAALVSARPGPRRAAPRLGTPLGLACRLHRGAAIAWGASIVALAVISGAFTQLMLDAGADLPPAFRELFTPDRLASGYVQFLSVMFGYLAAAYVVFALQSVRAEETSGRAELTLATATSRTAWAGSHLTAVTAAAAAIVVATGALTGATAAAVTGEIELIGQTIVAGLNVLPAVLVVIGIGAAAYGWAPRLLAPIGWALVAVMVFVGNFAALLRVPAWVLRLSPLDYPARYPLEAVAAAPLLGLLAVAAVGVAVGLVGLNRRQITGRG